MGILKRLKIAVLLLLAGCFFANAQDAHRFDPPWNKSPESAVNFTIPGINNVPDLYGDIVDPQLVVFFAGNQFMCIDDLLAGFRKKHPEIERIFAETLPPGILAKQIEGGSITIGNLRIGYVDNSRGLEVAFFVHNLLDQVRATGAIDFSTMLFDTMAAVLESLIPVRD